MAALEYFVHLAPADAPDDLVAVPADIPDRVSRLSVAVGDLPAAWRTYPAPESLADLGARRLRAGRSALLIVPSAVVPIERNYLVNPAHADARLIRIGPARPFAFDPRMWKRGGATFRDL